MSWYEHAIRRYEHRRWTTDDNRMVRPFAWGLEHLDGKNWGYHSENQAGGVKPPLQTLDQPSKTEGGKPNAENRDFTQTSQKEELRECREEQECHCQGDPRTILREYAQEAIARSEEWFAPDEVRDYHLDQNDVLTFTSPLESPYPENNVVHAQFFQARKAGPAVLVLANWNAKWHGQVSLCRWLQRIGITAVKMSLPYHDRRMVNGHERADQLVGPNIGLTLQANRQAVLDARACLTWLEQQGYTRLGILGTSIGSSVGYITLAHDRRVRAGGFFHVSTYFADVVSQGMTTNHVWEALRPHVSLEELREYWAPISPIPYVERGMGAGRSTFMVYGKYDPTFLPELTEEMLASLRRHGAEPQTLELPVGHYSLELAPFSYVAGWRMITFLLEALA